MVLLLLVSLCWAGKTAVGGCLGLLLEISGLMFCSMVLWRGGGVLPEYLLPDLLPWVGAWSLWLVGIAKNSWWSQRAILGLVLLVTQLIYTKFVSNNRALFCLW